ncbi:hypothetical protein F8O07_03865 [Pseudoclavibacter sp. CFCC 13796]|uniref:excalibur calcium-binding domain-containing protein n=1 Tax=Pseudoclavibacter sp. CFCC 13796 TaxID=2615179 RepID=UPI00130132E3|nr:excalibur calcium-binding domain-containing protein [Pseudoclavibacter sp. CFCC 13796]KAB1661102.1 hypothetical protein F8O07_03865 [Pseudoclavibacter sp. CFCC 13796]
MAKPGARKSRSIRVAGMVLALMLSGTLLSGCLESSEDVSKAEAKASQKAERAQQKAEEKARKEQEKAEKKAEKERKKAEEQQRKEAEVAEAAAEAERVRQEQEAESARVAEEQRQADERAKAEQAAQPRGFADTGSSSGGGDVSYANCTEVKRAGKAPLHQGQPGYSYKLDRDRDGIACEK